MHLKADFLEKIYLELSTLTERREEMLQEVRKLTIEIRRGFVSLWRQDLDEVERSLQSVRSPIFRLIADSSKNPELKTYVDPLCREYSELLCCYSILRGEGLPNPYEEGIPTVPYLHGLAEAVGELKRILFRCIIDGDLKRAVETFGWMEKIYMDLLPFSAFPDSLTGNFKRKCDLIRRNIEDAQTMISGALSPSRFK